MKQDDILVVGVIYNTFPETLRYLDSLSHAMAGNIILILVDNSDKQKPPEFLKKIKEYPFLQYIESGKNTGYFGGARIGLNYYLQSHTSYPKWILITNVDIVFSDHFFIRLNELSDQRNLGIVAPAIISQKWNTDYNPKILLRYTKRKLLLFRFLYSNVLMHNTYLLAAYCKKWMLGMRQGEKSVPENPELKGRKIYAPHGSCLVFRNTYFTMGGTLELPNFLFGEEILAGETALQLGLDVEYHPEIVIYDYEHASTGFFLTPKMSRYNRQAIQSVLDRYY